MMMMMMMMSRRRRRSLGRSGHSRRRRRHGTMLLGKLLLQLLLVERLGRRFNNVVQVHQAQIPFAAARPQAQLLFRLSAHRRRRRRRRRARSMVAARRRAATEVVMMIVVSLAVVGGGVVGSVVAGVLARRRHEIPKTHFEFAAQKGASSIFRRIHLAMTLLCYIVLWLSLSKWLCASCCCTILNAQDDQMAEKEDLFSPFAFVFVFFCALFPIESSFDQDHCKSYKYHQQWQRTKINAGALAVRYYSPCIIRPDISIEMASQFVAMK